MNVGLFTLAARQLTAAIAAEAQSPIQDLEGMTAVTLEASFTYGSGGGTAIVAIQTTFDGTNWLDIARFDFATATAKKVANLSGLLSKAVTSYAVLAAEGLLDGVLGNQLRAVITSTGTYVGSTLAVRASVR